ncbi:MAG: hypothetical protein ABI162_01995 [Luteolibacter sp.]
MKPIRHPAIVSLTLLAASTSITLAQEPADPTKAEIAELRQQVQDLTKVVKELQQQVKIHPAPTEPAETEAKPSHRKTRPSPELSDSQAVIESPPARHEPDLQNNLPADVLSVVKRSGFNPQFSMAIDTVAAYSASANHVEFDLRDFELTAQTNVDQFARAYMVVASQDEPAPQQLNHFYGSGFSVIEAAIETTALPYGLALKGGQFYADFTMLGKVHSHDLPFPNRPTALAGMLGGDTTSQGVELSWIPPNNQHVRLTAGAVDSIGYNLQGRDSSFAYDSMRSFGDVMYYGRAAKDFKLGDNTTLDLGIDYAHGTEFGIQQLGSADFKLICQPDSATTDRLEMGGEYLRGKSDGAFYDHPFNSPRQNPHQSITSDGAYVYAQYRIGKNWEPGIRYDWFQPEIWSLADLDRDGLAEETRTRTTQNSLSAYLTYHFSDSNLLRLGASHLGGNSGSFDGEDTDWLGFLQWSVTIGEHEHFYEP